MSYIDKEKEYIGALKVYLALITALLMGDISATIKLFQNNIFDFTFSLINPYLIKESPK